MNDDVPKRQKKEESGDSVSDGGDLPKSTWLRRFVQDDAGFDRFILAYNGVFLPGISLILWLVFLVIR